MTGHLLDDLWLLLFHLIDGEHGLFIGKVGVAAHGEQVEAREQQKDRQRQAVMVAHECLS